MWIKTGTEWKWITRKEELMDKNKEYLIDLILDIEAQLREKDNP